MATILSKDLAESSLDLLAHAGDEGVVVYKDGQPVARLTPIVPSHDKPKTGVFLVGALKGQISITGDIYSTGVEWDAESGHAHHSIRDQSDINASRTRND